MCIGIALKMMSMLLCCCRKEFWCCLFRWLTMIQVGTNSRLFEALRMYLCKAAYRLKTAWIHNKESNNFQNLDYNTRSNELPSRLLRYSLWYSGCSSRTLRLATIFVDIFFDCLQILAEYLFCSYRTMLQAWKRRFGFYLTLTFNALNRCIRIFAALRIEPIHGSIS